MKVLTVFGTRPEASKLAPVIRESWKHPDRVVCKVCVTAQYRQMLDQVLHLFGIISDHSSARLRAGPSASSGQALRQAQGRPFGKLRAGDLNVMEDNQPPACAR